ncbi:MAG: ATP-dependent 6-phosphofructokinase [Candidatus Binatia bacterium]
MTLPKATDLAIATLGPTHVISPLRTQGQRFTDETGRVLLSANLRDLQPFLDTGQQLPAFELAGPRDALFFNPQTTTCGIVTCGGLCPGVNDVIRSLVLTLRYSYGIPRILGFRYGYAGLSAKNEYTPLELTPDVVDTIHEQGGTLLGSSRGPQELDDMIATLVHHQVAVLFAIGGDGTLRGASALSRAIQKLNLPIAVIGIPKTIDNDLDWIERSFGFATAVEEATKAIEGAHNEARGAWNGIGLVKLMGRHSGFIAAHATLANSNVNFCLTPEVPFALAGERGFLQVLEHRLERRRHAVIVVAEGAGQELLQDAAGPTRDASGNIRLQDIGPFLRDEIIGYFKNRGTEITIKYIDPSYMIRSLPANAFDSEFCLLLGQYAAHAGLAGRTDMVVGYWNQYFTHVPTPVAVAQRKQLDPTGAVWQSVLQATGQPAVMR